MTRAIYNLFGQLVAVVDDRKPETPPRILTQPASKRSA
jgi:hypothetical protein